jgi:hypothetical protein
MEGSSRSTASGSLWLGSPVGQSATATIFWNALSDETSKSEAYHPMFAREWFPLFFDPQYVDAPSRTAAALASRTSERSSLLNSHEVWTNDLPSAAIKPLLHSYSVRPELKSNGTFLPFPEPTGIPASPASFWDSDTFYQGDFLGEEPILVTLAVLTGTAAVEFRPESARNEIAKKRLMINHQ